MSQIGQIDNNINNSSESLLNTTSADIENNNINMQNLICAPKRGREPHHNSLLDSLSKTPRLSTNDSPFKLINIVDKRFDNMLGLFKTMLEESEMRIEKMLDTRFNEMKRDILDINQRVSKLETVVDDIMGVKAEVQKLKTQLQRQENSFVATDLRITGIPFRRDENLFDVFKSICDLLNIPTPAIKTLYRLQNHNNKDNGYSPDAVIMVKLCSPYDKNFILKSLANFRKANKTSLILNHIGYGSDRAFYVNENLTTTNHKILMSALNLKKRRLVKSAYTIRGLVFIKFKDNEEPVRVETIEELNNFFPDEGISTNS